MKVTTHLEKGSTVYIYGPNNLEGKAAFDIQWI